MTAKLTAEERSAIWTRLRGMCDPRPCLVTVASFAEVEVELDREQRAGKLATVEALCRSVLSVDSGSHGFSGVQKLAARVLEIIHGSGA